jgi:hypothetical protein
MPNWRNYAALGWWEMVDVYRVVREADEDNDALDVNDLFEALKLFSPQAKLQGLERDDCPEPTRPTDTAITLLTSAEFEQAQHSATPILLPRRFSAELEAAQSELVQRIASRFDGSRTEWMKTQLHWVERHIDELWSITRSSLEEAIAARAAQPNVAERFCKNFDGLNMRAPWRLEAYNGQGVLTQEEIAELASRFELSQTQVEALSICLGDDLDSELITDLREVSRAKATGKPGTDLRRWLRWSKSGKEKDGRKKLNEILKNLTSDFAITPADADVLAKLKSLAASADSSTADLEAAVERVLATPDCAAEMRPDNLKTPDMRRKRVARSCMLAWIQADRPLTKGNPNEGVNAGGKGGPLIDFIQAVGLKVTDPPTLLSGNTLSKDIDAFDEYLEAFGESDKELYDLAGPPVFGRP